MRGEDVPQLLRRAVENDDDDGDDDDNREGTMMQVSSILALSCRSRARPVLHAQSMRAHVRLACVAYARVRYACIGRRTVNNLDNN
mmetsp:Transcript_11187/g.21451  ORF Transcript_11187/g.21451 Transcript_11187/m.21451 type:complete len:86 (+) Transcript_11187:806-1063(+)